jgi:clorobiocin biosynthesis protein CloN7
MIGSPMDSTGFAPLANALADQYTVVTYDPRGIGNSSRQDTTEDVTPEQQAEDVHRLLSALGGQPAYVFGSSGGAVVGLALVTAHPDQVRTLVAHEPPVVELLPDSAQVRPDRRHLRHVPGRGGRQGDAEVHGPCRPSTPAVDRDLHGGRAACRW